MWGVFIVKVTTGLPIVTKYLANTWDVALAAGPLLSTKLNNVLVKDESPGSIKYFFCSVSKI